MQWLGTEQWYSSRYVVGELTKCQSNCLFLWEYLSAPRFPEILSNDMLLNIDYTYS